MTPTKRRPRVRLGWLGLSAFVALVLAAAVYGFVLAPDLYPPTVLPTAATPAQGAAEAARLSAITTTRTGILAALAGVGALITIAINYRNSTISNETFRIAERGQLTDRYAKAIELLGDTESVAIRLGGIYALQQFALDTRRPEDQNTVVEVLSAFVRLNLRPAALPESASTGAQQPAATPRRRVAGIRKPLLTDKARPSNPAADVLAAISVLAQLPDRGINLRADFTGLDFTGINMTGARLAHANLSGVNLHGVNLDSVDLRGANLSGAELRRANLRRANLEGANLSGASLKEATLVFALLDGANLASADLQNANLRGSFARDASFSGAFLRSANLTDALLTRADLSRAQFRRANLASADLANADLRDAVLSLADLSNAELNNANVAGAGFSGTTLADADMSGVVGLGSSQLTEVQRAIARNVPAARG